MNTPVRFALVFLCWLASSQGTFADPASSLDVPPTQTLALTLTAKGVQIYECRAVASDPSKFEWAFKAPEADLFDAQGHKVGRHHAGPTWELVDGGKVVGKLKAKADAPDGRGVPWLLLDAAQASGPTLGKVQSVQRVDTVGGKAPTEAADATKVGQEKRVDYTATYKFYVLKS